MARIRVNMRVDLRVDRGSLRRWHLALAERLQRRPGAEIGFRVVERPRFKPAEVLFRVETLLFGLERGGVAEPVGVEALGRFAPAGKAQLVIDLASEPEGLAGEKIWRVECDGVGLEPWLLAASLEGRSPVVRVLGPDSPLSVARPGSDRIGLVAAAFADCLERVTTLIEAALDGAALGVPPSVPGEATAGFDPAALAPARWAVRTGKAVKQRTARAAYATLFHAPHWRVGWRRAQKGFPGDLAGGLGGGWSGLADDGRRFYADPFAVERGGRTFLFVEDFEHRLGRGIISAVEFSATGAMGKPEPALVLPTHLSYPNVFERDGEMWMIPETGATGTIDLYRAREFPFSWKLETRLVCGVVASDATLVEWQGRWWMFATVRDGGGAHSDALWLWSAPDFRGPWTAHPHNPVLIDIASARPAGNMFMRDGKLYRPVQDCRRGYGAALALARVDRLDEGGYAQTIEAVINPGADWPGRRLHTYNFGGGFEFIDGSAFAPRWPALRHPLALASRRQGRLALA
jgi:hypothetical protein